MNMPLTFLRTAMEGMQSNLHVNKGASDLLYRFLGVASSTVINFSNFINIIYLGEVVVVQHNK